MAVIYKGFATSEGFVVTDDHDAIIPGCVPTPWLFYSGIDGNPGRYFLVIDGEITRTTTGYWFDERPASAGWLKVCTSDGKQGTVRGSHVWHESLGLSTPRL